MGDDLRLIRRVETFSFKLGDNPFGSQAPVTNGRSHPVRTNSVAAGINSLINGPVVIDYEPAVVTPRSVGALPIGTLTDRQDQGSAPHF